ncbi:MAG TPA: iron ABC transporter permease [bacterium]|nr:iron ABC transporter permease [bacterium]
MNGKIIRWGMIVFFLAVLLFAVSVFSLALGSVAMPLKRIFAALFEGGRTPESAIVLEIRLPRIFLGCAIGGSLALAGVILQGMFRNPLVEPYTLGISGGAGVGVALGIVLHLTAALGPLSLPAFGFAGACLVMALVYALSFRRRVLKVQGLLLSGVMISFISSSLIMLIMSVSRAEDLHGIIFWIMGSLDELGRPLIVAAACLSLAGLGLSYLFCRELNALALGEEGAKLLGVPVERTKRSLFFIASFLTGFSVSVAGIIGFVGLVVPHFVRLYAGRDHRILLIASFLSGGIFLIFCDAVARWIIAPLELPVGVITGLLGGVLFVSALTRKDVVL